RRSLSWLVEYRGLEPLRQALFRLPFRGIKGPVGTQQDQLDLLTQDDLCDRLDTFIAQAFGFSRVLISTGQVYPRSVDLDVLTSLRSVVAMFPRTPWVALLDGYVSMVTAYSGDQWNEGDVSTSVVRRVALPGAFFATELATRCK
ncbi:MAG: hypothetical protein M3Q75_10075, partial [Gemmatimonadota bacterium]|nr:hypothetical protein [Gemmatimonadota bacterium]